MARIGRRITLLLLAVSLAGCFRQADPTEGDAVTLAPPPTNSSPVLPTQNLEPTNTQPLLVTVPATETPDAINTQVPDEDLPTSTPEQMFITPESPFSTLVVGTATFTPGTPASMTPGGLITPTDFLNSSGSESSNSACEYQVRSGDSLFRIAINNDTTVEAIKAQNNLPNDNIFPGDILIIPDCDTDETTDNSGTTDTSPGAVATALPAGWQTHTVRSGEVLGSIAERYGVRQSRIIEANNLTNPNSLSVGQQLVIPAPE